MDNINLSDIVVIAFFSILAQIPQAYLAYSAGIAIKNELIIAVSILVTIFGMIIVGVAVVNYLRGRMIEKHMIQAPLTASLIVILIQYLIFIWSLSGLLGNELFINRFADLFVFSQVISVTILLILVIILTPE